MTDATGATGESRPDRRGPTLAWTSSTYFGEGLPWSILHQVASEYLTAIGMPPTQVGYTSLLNGTTMLKFVWSPLVDLFGTLRRWMVATQLTMGVLVGVLALVADGLARQAGAAPDTTRIWLLLFVIGVLSATYDIACDGYYMAALGKEDQARYSGTRVAAYRAAMLVGSSGLVFLGGRFSWLLAFGIAAALLIVLAWVHQRYLGARTVRGEAARAVRPPTARSAKLAHIRRAYSSFLFQPQALLVIAFLMSYKMGDVLMFSMSKVLLARELGVPTDVRGVLNSVSLGASILGAILGGSFIARRSLKGALMTITLWMALTAPLFALLAAFAPDLRIAVPGSVQDASGLVWSQAWPGLACICSVIVIEQICGGMATAAQVVFIMQRTLPEHRAAHYAFATAVYSLPQTLVGASSGKLYEAFGPVAYFWFVSLLMLPAIVLARLVPSESAHEERSEPTASA